MKKKFLNPYKWKKRMKRGVISSSSQHAVSIEDRLSLRPNHGEDRWRRNPYEPAAGTLKLKAECILLGLTLLTLFILCFFHPYFSLRTFSFQGLERIDEKKLLTSLDQDISGRRFLLFSKKNYFSVNLNQLRDALNSEYSFETLTIEKKFPHSLHLEVTEKPPAFIYDNGLTYTLIGEKGEKLEKFRDVDENEWQVVTKMVTSTNEIGEEETQQQMVGRTHKPDLKRLLVANKKLSVLYDTRTNAADIPMVFSENFVQGITKWNSFLDNKSIQVNFIELLDGGEEGYIRTTQGWGIYVKFADADLALPIFVSVLPQINRASTQYIDMRYLNRVYWK